MKFLKKANNDNLTNSHYFKGATDGISYLFVAYLLPLIMLLGEMIFSINNASYLIISSLILTFSLGRDYFFAYYDRVNSKYLLFGVLLCVQILVCGFFYIVIGHISISEHKFMFTVFYVLFCILSFVFYLCPLPYFIKDCKALAQEFFNKENCINLGPLSKNNMAHGVTYAIKEKE